MDGNSILIIPIERVLKPLVARRSGERERQRQSGDQQSGQSGYGRSASENSKRAQSNRPNGLLSDHLIDFRI